MAKKYNCTKNGRQYFRITRTINGKRKEFYGDGEKDAIRQYTEYMKQVTLGMDPEAANRKFDEAFREWLYSVKKYRVRESSMRSYDTIYRRHIKGSSLSDKKLCNIKRMDIEKFAVEQYELGYSEASVEQYLALLSSYFTDLVESDILPKNPAYRVRAPKDESDVEDEIVVFTKEEQDAILQASYDMKNGFLFELALRSGLRRGELLALEYSDFTDNGVWVRKTLVNVPVTGEDGSKKWVHKVTITKSQSGHRFVPLPQDVLVHLTEHRRAQVKQLGGSFSKIVFTTKTGKHLSLSSIGYKQSNLLRNLDLPHKKFHSYRHTYITNCIESGLDIATVQELAGHSSLDMTRRYVHLSTEHKVRAVQKMYEAMS